MNMALNATFTFKCFSLSVPTKNQSYLERQSVKLAISLEVSITPRSSDCPRKAGRKFLLLGYLQNSCFACRDYLFLTHTVISYYYKSVYCRLEPIQEKNMETIFRFQFAAKNIDVSRNSFSKLRGNIFHSLPDTVLEIAKSNSGGRGQAW
jgi:hypothetical protein